MSLRIFLAELVGTFGLLVSAAGSIVYDGMMGGALGITFISAAHFAGLAILIFVFGRYSMAHFNPIVTLGFWITGYTSASKVPIYIAAQAAGAFAGIIAVRYMIGDYAGLGHNHYNPALPISLVFGAEVLATIFLLGSILLVVGSGRRPLVASLTIALVVGLDVYFFGLVSGASMNPMRSLAPAVLAGQLNELWLYWTAPFVGMAMVAVLFKRRFGHLARQHA